MTKSVPRRRWGKRKDWCDEFGQSPATLHRLEERDPNAPRPRRLPTGGVLRDLDAWREYFANLPAADDQVA